MLDDMQGKAKAICNGEEGMRSLEIISAAYKSAKTGQKVMVKQKKIIHWKMSKDLFKKINNEK